MCAQSRGADPSILSDDYDTYLNPGKKTPADTELSCDQNVKDKILALEKLYASVPKVLLSERARCAIVTPHSMLLQQSPPAFMTRSDLSVNMWCVVRCSGLAWPAMY